MDSNGADAAREQARLVEYQEIGAFLRHEESSKWLVISGAILGAVSVVGWSISNVPWLLPLALLLSAGVLWGGAGIHNQIASATAERLARALEIEHALEMRHHMAFAEPKFYRSGATGAVVNGMWITGGVLAGLGILLLLVLPCLYAVVGHGCW